LLEHGSIADAKIWFEGMGKTLQLKNVTGSGRKWIGVPIIITA
jgi:hypothetical protein